MVSYFKSIETVCLHRPEPIDCRLVGRPEVLNKRAHPSVRQKEMATRICFVSNRRYGPRPTKRI
jgi:hypothetical protein